MAVQVGQKAPAFTLVDTEKKQRTLQEFAGKTTVLVFYPGAFTGVCTKEMCTFRDSMARLNNLHAQVIGISVDAPFAQKAFAEKNNLQFPLLCDYNRDAIKAFDIVHENFAGLAGYTAAKRSVFIIDASQTVTYAWIAENPGVEPNYDEITTFLSK